MSGAADIVVFTQGRGLPMLKNGKFKELFAVPGGCPVAFSADEQLSRGDHGQP